MVNILLKFHVKKGVVFYKKKDIKDNERYYI